MYGSVCYMGSQLLIGHSVHANEGIFKQILITNCVIHRSFICWLDWPMHVCIRI